MRTTFYIASAPDNYVAVRNLADFFISRGWRWSPGNAWQRKRVYEPEWVSRDMHAALSADVFVLLLPTDPKATVGPHAQMAARWAVHRTIYGVRNGAERHPLHDLPGITWFDEVQDLAQGLFWR